MSQLPLTWEQGKEPFISHDANGVLILQRRNDGYIDATAMCRAYNKLFADWQRLDQTKEWLSALCSNMGIPILELVQSRVGGAHSGTWVHRRVALQLAQWLSPRFGVTVNGWIDDWLTTGQAPVIKHDDFELRRWAQRLSEQFRTDVRDELLPMRQQLDLLNENVVSLKQFISDVHRKSLNPSDGKFLTYVVWKLYGGHCPGTGVRILNDDGSRIKDMAEEDHFYLVGTADIHNFWLIYKEYHRSLGPYGSVARWEATPAFQSFQIKLRSLETGSKIVSFRPPQRKLFD